MLVDRDLVARIESFLSEAGAAPARALAELEPESGATVAERAGGAVVYMGPEMFVNRAIGLGVSEPALAADVDFVVDFYAERDRQAEIELCPHASDAVRERAAERGFTLDWFRNLYAARLDDLGPGASAAVGAGVALTPVDDSNFATWEGVWLYDGADPVVSRFVRAVYQTAVEHAFVASIDGAPVAVCSIRMGGGIADFGGMSTLPAFRRRGVQRACIAARLELARAAGCDLAVSGATPGGESARNIERAGFTCLYTSVGLVRPRDP